MQRQHAQPALWGNTLLLVRPRAATVLLAKQTLTPMQPRYAVRALLVLTQQLLPSCVPTVLLDKQTLTVTHHQSVSLVCQGRTQAAQPYRVHHVMQVGMAMLPAPPVSAPATVRVVGMRPRQLAPDRQQVIAFRALWVRFSVRQAVPRQLTAPTVLRGPWMVIWTHQLRAHHVLLANIHHHGPLSVWHACQATQTWTAIQARSAMHATVGLSRLLGPLRAMHVTVVLLILMCLRALPA